MGYLRATARPDDDRALDFALVVRPDHRDGEAPLRLVDAAIEYALSVDADAVSLWTFGADVDTDALAAAAGLEPQRELWQMRVPLPARVGRRSGPTGSSVRTFVPGDDDDAWLDRQQRRVRGRPRPGRLDARRSSPAASPSRGSIRTAFSSPTTTAAIAGFCWTKVHPPEPPHEPRALGEIYVIGVDPGHQGLGLGRALVLAGLAHLHDVRHLEVGMLFVDVDQHRRRRAVPGTGLRHRAASTATYGRARRRP